MFRKNRKNTEIVLSRSNLSALLHSLEVLKVCFGQDVEFLHSTIELENADSDYEVTVTGKIPMTAGDVDLTTLFTASVRFVPHDVYPHGFTAVEIVRGLYLENGEGLKLEYVAGKYSLTEESQSVLDEFRERVRPYRQNW